MIPYFQAGQSFVVAEGQPGRRSRPRTDLCGKAVAAETGTTEVDYLKGTGDYKGQGLSAACTKAGKAAINVKTVRQGHRCAARPPVGGQVDAYFADSPVAGLLHDPAPRPVRAVGIAALASAIEGISVPKDKHRSARRGPAPPCCR